MNCYIIANPSYEDPLCEFIAQSRKKGKKNGINATGRALLSNSQVFIDNKASYDSDNFKGAFHSRSGQDTVFIVPELNWDGSLSVDAGYEIALDILNGKLKKYPFFNLIFISLYTRDQLLRQVSAEHVEMVRSFPHLCLTDLGKTQLDTLIPAYSEIHFTLLKRNVASKSGRLDSIKHRLSYLEDPENTDSSWGIIKEILGVLSSPSFACPDGDMPQRLDYLLEQSRHPEKVNDLKKYVEELRQYNKDLMSHFVQGQTCTVKSGYSVLIFEDEEYYRIRLEDLFKEYFISVKSYPVCSITDIEKSMLEIAGKHDLIIFDMMYLLNGGQMPFNGFDLLFSLRKAEAQTGARKAAVRVITALPRNTLSSLVQDCLHIESPVIFTKGNGWEQLKGCLIDRMDEILRECEDNNEAALHDCYYPKNGVFVQGGMRDALLANRDKFDEAVKYAEDLVHGRLPQKLTDKDIPVGASETNPQKLLDRLKQTMAHRRLVIEFLRGTELDEDSFCVYNEDKYREFILNYVTEEAAIRIATNKTRYNTKYIQSQLGFTVVALSDPDKSANSYTKDDKAKKGTADKDGAKSQKDSDERKNYVCRVDLEAYMNFFKEEFDAEEGDGENPTLINWLDFVDTVLMRRMENDVNGVSLSFHDCGVNAFLVEGKEGHTADSLIALFNSVYQYVSDSKKDKNLRKALLNLFVDNFDIENYPHRLVIMKKAFPELIECSTRLMDYRLP